MATVYQLSSKEVIGLDSVNVIRKVAYARGHDEHGAVHSLSVLTTDNVVQSKLPFHSFSHNHHRIFLRQQEQDKDPFGFMLYSAQVNQDEAEAEFFKITATLAPILDAGYVKLNKKLLNEIVLPAPMEPEKLTFHIVTLMRRKPHIYQEWVKLLQSLLEFASSKDDDKAVKTLLMEGADPSRKKHLVHTLVHQKSKKAIVALIAHTHNKGIAWDMPDYSEQPNKEENGDPDPSYACPDLRRSTMVPCQLSCVEVKDLLNAFDTHDMTPLMLSVQDLQMDSTLHLLMGGADPNIAQPSTGDTVLHMATRLANVQLVKLIIAYRGNISILNKKSQTPFDIAKEQGNEEIVEVLEEVKAAEEVAKEAKGMDVKLEPGSLSLLSLDGGGIRALMTVQVLLAIEKKMKSLDPSCKSIMDYFDYVAGTSVGGIILGCVVLGDHPLADMDKVIYNACVKTFSGKREERVQEADLLIGNAVGAETKMMIKEKPRVMITAAIVNRSPCDLHWFTNFGESANNQPSPEDQDVVGAIRATTAAPFYFPPYKGIFVDGGVVANNPTVAAMSKIFDQMEEEKKAQKLGCVVSLGTGIFPSKVIHDIDIFVPSIPDALRNIRGTLQGVANFLDLLVSRTVESNGQPVTHARSWCRSLNCPFFRLNQLLPKEITLDSIDHDDIIILMYAVRLYILKEAAMIETVACTLLSRGN